LDIDMEKRRRWCWLKHQQGWSVRTIASHLNEPKTTVHRWIRWSEEGRQLTNLSSRPRSPHRRVDRALEDEVCSLRRERGWGPDKIKGYLRRNGIEVGQSTIYRVLKRNGLNSPLVKPRRKNRYIRWERASPNELWQCDWKWVKEQNRWLVAFIDDHSRFVVSAKMYDSATTENTIDCLLDGIRRCGTPEEILTDHGTQFYAVRRGESSFDRKLKELGIAHIMSGIGKPTTTGKIERFFATYFTEAWRYNTLDGFIQYYNYIRPHQSLDYATPFERFGTGVPKVMT